MIRASETEYKKAAFGIEKQAEEHASSVVPCRLDCVFGVSSLEQGNGFVRYPLMSQYPQTSPAKRPEAVEPTAFPDDVLDTSVQTLGNRIGSAYVPGIQNIFDMPVDGIGGFYDLFDSAALHHPYPEAKTLFHLLSGGISVITPLEEELLAQIGQFQVIGFRRRKSIDEPVFLPGGKPGFAFVVELSASIDRFSEITVLLIFCNKGISYSFTDIIKALAYKLCDMELIGIDASIGEEFLFQGDVVLVQIARKALNLVSLLFAKAFQIGSDVPWFVSLDHVG